MSDHPPGIAILVTDAEVQILHANACAERLRASDDGQPPPPRQFGPECAQPSDTRRLCALIHDAARGGPGGAIQIARSPDRRPHVAIVSQSPIQGSVGP